MQLCGNCLREMTCTKTGLVVRWRGAYCKRGDSYACGGCGAQVVAVAETAEGYEDTRAAAASSDTYLELP